MHTIIKKPVITEQSMREAALGRFTFVVEKSANKAEIAQAIKEAFSVTPVRVQTQIVKGKSQRSRKSRTVAVSAAWKKAIITLVSGQKIDLFEIGEQAAVTK